MNEEGSLGKFMAFMALVLFVVAFKGATESDLSKAEREVRQLRNEVIRIHMENGGSLTDII